MMTELQDPVRPCIFMVEGDGGDDVGEDRDDWEEAVGGADVGGDEEVHEESWDDLAEAPLELDPEDSAAAASAERDDVFVDSDGGEFQSARGAPTPKAPSRDVQARHNLTHLPYASWCPWCVMGRRSNAPHFRSQDGSDRSLPLLVADYAFVRDKDDDVLATLLVCKLYPSRKVMACVVESKGVVDLYGVQRVTAFIRESGLVDFNFVVKSDQESSIVAMLEQAIRRSGRHGSVVPEASAVGESASNSRAERTIQAVEDMLRVHKHALEARLGKRVTSDSAILKWLVEHVADILTKYTVNSNGMSPYEELHGRKAQERRVEFGERVFFSTPKKGRAKLDKRWRLGVYIGHAPNSNEQYIGLKNGNVIRARSTVRVVQRSRWDANAVLGVTGTPADPTPTPDEELTPDDIEASEAPHDFDASDVEPEDVDRPTRSRTAEPEPDEARPDLREPLDAEMAAIRKIRITQVDLGKYGYSPGCVRCEALAIGNTSITTGHTDACRKRMYEEYRKNNDPKWRRVQEEIRRARGESGPRTEHQDPRDGDDEPPARRARQDVGASSSQQPAVHPSSPRQAAASSSQEPASSSRSPPPTAAPTPRRDHPIPPSPPTGVPSTGRLRPGVGGSPRIGKAAAPPPPPPQETWLEPESDGEDFREPEAKRARRRTRSEDDGAEVFGNFDEDDEEQRVANALLLCGVKEGIAQRKAADMVAPSKATFVEMYGRGAIMREANTTRRDLNVEGLAALDLRTSKPDGSAWNFNLKGDRQMAMDLIDKEDPYFVIGSPPCTAFCAWNTKMNFRKMDQDQVAEVIREGQRHLNFMIRIYRKQMQKGRCFVHEHPASAVSWNEKEMVKLIAMPGVILTRADQCMYGLETRSSEGGKALALKPTKFLTNAEPMAKLLRRRCDGSHPHQALVSGRCADAAFYPLPLIRTLIRGIRDTRAADDQRKEIISQLVADVDELEQVRIAVVDTTGMVKVRVNKVGGGYMELEWDDRNFKEVYRDEYTGEILPTELIRAAIKEELSYFNQHVWEVTEKDGMRRFKDSKLVRCRWVLCNKGDSVTPDVRARLVACEVNHDGTREDSYFASTPPLEAKRMLFAKFAEQPSKDGIEQRLSFVDVRKAYFNGIPRRNLFMHLPRELGLPGHWVGRQIRCVYGTRDAGAIWEDTYRDLLEAIGFRSGRASPCVFYHPEKDISTVVHGDDFTSLGSDAALDWMEGEMAKSFELKLRGRLGRDLPGELRILNRIVRITDTGLEYEADPRHVELISESLELNDCKPVSTPGVKNHAPDLESVKSDDIPNASLEVQVDDQHDQIHNLNDFYAAVTSDSSYFEGMTMATRSRSCISSEMSRRARRGLSIGFDEVTTTHEVPAYSTIYGMLPYNLFATAAGWKVVGPRSNPFTGKSAEVMKARMMARARYYDRGKIDTYRNAMVRIVNGRLDGHSTLVEPEGVSALIDKKGLNASESSHELTAAQLVKTMSELPTVDSIAAVKSKSPAKYKKRLGAKQVKNFEKEAALADGLLKANAATTFRAVSARSNYLAQDRPDGTFSSKELCREFSRPNTMSLQKLKRLGRYYVGRPRLVYKFDFGEKASDVLDVFCDTDFAGCSQTRRSTSGGCALIGGKLIKHWSKTQPTIALSSGEAELVGIGQGIAQAMGLQSLAADMEWALNIRVHSDATAAIGIAKRRGLRKVRHLQTTDLWIQEKVHSGDVQLVKIKKKNQPSRFDDQTPQQ